MNTRDEKLKQLAELRPPGLAVLSHIQQLKGEKRDKGDTGAQGPQGVKGNKGDTGETGARGEKGDTGAAGRDGRHGIDGVNGKDGRDGTSGVTPTTDIVVEEVVSRLTTGKTLKIEHIEGLPKSLGSLVDYLKRGGFRGGGSASTSATVTFFSDTVSGTIDGANKTFTVPNTVTSALALHLANSIYQPTVDFTVSGTTVTMVVAPDASLSGQPFWLLHT